MEKDVFEVVEVLIDNNCKVVKELAVKFTGNEKECVNYAVSNSLPFLHGFILKRNGQRYRTVIY